MKFRKWKCGFATVLMSVMLLTPSLNALAAGTGTWEDTAMEQGDAEKEAEKAYVNFEGFAEAKKASYSDATEIVAENKEKITEDIVVSSDSVELVNDLSYQSGEEVDYDIASDSDAELVNDLSTEKIMLSTDTSVITESIAMGLEEDIVDSGMCGDAVEWILYADGLLIISGTGDMYDSTDTLPGFWFLEEDITEVVIEEGVTAIGDYAFASLSLESISIPDSIIDIGAGAFYCCRNLMEIEIPDGVTSVKEWTFGYCENLVDITMPGSITNIETKAFYYCKSLEEIIIPDGVVSIGDSAFAWCESLKNISIPNTVTDIGEEAFLVCLCITDIVIPDGVTSISDGTFDNCLSLESVIIPDSVTTIGKSAFSGCNLNRVTIPQNVASIADYAFQNCDNLAEIMFLGNAPSIAGHAFSNVETVAYYPIDDVTWTDNVMLDYGGTIIWAAVAEDGSVTAKGSCYKDLTWILDLNGLLTISGSGDMLFYSSEKPLPWAIFSEFIAEVVIEEGVTGIGSSAFSDCSELVKIEIADSVTSIGTEAFYNCYSLKNIVIPVNIWDIEPKAFGGCTGLSEITFLGNAPDIIEEDSFNNVTATVYYPADDSTWTEDVMLNYGGTLTWLPYGESTVVVTPDAPVISSVVNSSNGLKITWNSVDNADRYYVYRKASGETFQKVKTTSYTYYTDEDVTDGITYIYKVKARGGSNSAMSAYSTTKSYKRLAGTVISDVGNTSTALKITWEASDNAKKYYIYRKAADESVYTRVKATTYTSYSDTDVREGITYSYRVVVVNGSYISVESATKSYKRLGRTTISALANTSTGMKITWNAVTGAKYYYIYRKAAEDSSYKKIKSATGTSYTDTSAANGTTYTYRIKVVNGSYSGVYSTTKSKTRLKAITLNSVTNSASKKVTVKWAKNTKATGYQIQYSTDSSFGTFKSTKVTGASTASNVISGLTKGSTYYVRIRSYITVNGTTSYSGWSGKKSVKIDK